MKNQILLGFILILLIPISAKSQVNYRPGYIITNSHDTIYGKIDYRRDVRMSKVCAFKTKESGKKNYYPGDILGFRFENHRYFVTAKVDQKLVFLEQLIKGEVSIYYYDDNSKTRYFFSKNGGKITELKYFKRTVDIDEYGRASDGKNYKIAGYAASDRFGSPGEYLFESQEFKKTLLDSLGDEKDIRDDINSLKKPNHRDLIEIAKEYHKLKGSNQKIVVFNDLKYKSDYDFSIGWISINYRRFGTDKTHLMYSLKRYVPLTNRKIYLGYGIQYIPAKRYNTSYKIFRVPLSIRYKYPGNIVQPHAALGLNIYAINNGNRTEFIQDFVPSYNLGFAIKVYKAIHLSFDLEGDLLWISYYNSSSTAPFSQAKCVGLEISL